MKALRIVHYEVAVSPRFPSTHIRKGQPTYFVEKIELALNILVELPGDILIDLEPKCHTCRKNYPMWVKRMKKVNEGKAVIDLFYWKLKGGRYTPGNEKIVFATLDNTYGCGVQELTFGLEKIDLPFISRFRDRFEPMENIAQNDGLSPEDYKSWFKGYDLTEPLALIQFTSFRY